MLILSIRTYVLAHDKYNLIIFKGGVYYEFIFKKEVILLRELVNKENQEYYKKQNTKQNTKYDSDLDKRNKDINNAYKILKKF